MRGTGGWEARRRCVGLLAGGRREWPVGRGGGLRCRIWGPRSWGTRLVRKKLVFFWRGLRSGRFSLNGLYIGEV